MPDAGPWHRGCAYPVVEVCKSGKRCVPRERCPAGRPVYRDKFSHAGHHHLGQEWGPGDLIEKEGSE